MFKVKLDDNGNLVVNEITRSDEDLIVFSAKSLQINDCFDSIQDAICTNVIRRKPGNLTSYITVWFGWKDGEKIKFLVGIREKEAEMHLHAITDTMSDFDSEQLVNDVCEEQMSYEWDNEYQQELYCRKTTFLIHENSKIN